MSTDIFHITTGDIDGIGLEVSLKSIKKIQAQVKNKSLVIWMHQSQKKLLQKFLNHNSIIKKNSKLVNSFSEISIESKFNFVLNEKNEPAHWFISASMDCIQNNSSIITAPLSKTQIISEGLKDVGHTEILKRLTKTDNLKMCFFGKYFSMILYTDHIPINKIRIDENVFISFLDSCYKLHKKFKSKKSQIYVLGLNPHAGDSGIIGTEDKLIFDCSNKVFKTEKVLPADSAFVNFKNFKNNPTFISCYHDQGLIPFKMAHGFNGFHYTMGLPFIRTSVDHGTAKDIFNKNKANANSMTDAILAAFRLTKDRSFL